jgi:UDPglucose--hexose-1-phosphate uridylyltransferase
LCPGVTRPNGVTNPEYKDTYVFDNDFPALFDYNLSNESELTEKDDNADPVKSDLFKTLPAKGSCKVMCFHPYSDLTLPTMDQSDIVKVIKRWVDLYIDQREKYDWIQIFENKGEMMGKFNLKSLK